MNALAVECCTETCSVAACCRTGDGWTVWWRAVHQAGQQLSLLAPLLQEVLAELPTVRWDRIGVTHGPGTFTGLRIGLATARTLAQVWDIPVVAVGTLDATACNSVGLGVFPCNETVERRVLRDAGDGGQGCPHPGDGGQGCPHPGDGGQGCPHPGPVTVVLDARKGELFTASYSLTPRDCWPQPEWGPSALQPLALTPQRRLSGSGLKRYPDLPCQAACPPIEWWPSAAHVAMAAAGVYRNAPPPQSWVDVAAAYLRAADAQIPSFMQAP